jgi:hypothetical protein
MAKIKEAIEDFKPDSRLVDERGPTDARIRKSEGYDIGKADGRYTMRDAPIEIMAAKKILTEKQYQALTKYRIHWFNAGLSESFGGMDPNHIFASDISNFAGMAKTERQVFHRQRWRAANLEMRLKGTWVVTKIVCEEWTAEQTGRAMGWNNRPQAVAASTQLLRDAADRLCSLWGM